MSETTAAAPARILVIDDEPQIRKFLDISLRAQGYRVESATDGEAGLQALATHGADLVILDLGLPDLDGHEVLARLREWSQAPVIVLTVRADEREKVAALDAGANDYVTKPFGVQELMARVRALLRWRMPPQAKRLRCSTTVSCAVDLARREVFLQGKPVQLARKEYALLALLLQHSGRVVTQPQILRTLWGGQHDHDTHYLRVLAGKLRQKLGDDARSGRDGLPPSPA